MYNRVLMEMAKLTKQPVSRLFCIVFQGLILQFRSSPCFTAANLLETNTNLT